MMQCAISGEAPQAPVVSRKTGNVYEKRLIESFINENGTEPTTGEPLTVEDLLDVKTAQIVKPRPPTLTSIPALLGIFQEEWDALALETFNLQQNLAQARQELSTALYQNDAAVRAITRLTKERDDARTALATLELRGATTNGSNGDVMQVDHTPLSDTILAEIDRTQERLSKTRRKRPVPEGWATSDQIASYAIGSTSEPLYSGTKFLAINSTGDLVLMGGSDGIAGIYSVSQRQITQVLQSGSGSITSGIWADNKAIISTSSGTVKIFEAQKEIASFNAHSKAVTGLAIHPGGRIVASVSRDKSYVLYDLESLKVLTQIFSNAELTCVQFHPDGHLLAMGAVDGELKIYDVKSGSIGGIFNTESQVQTLFFSENGTWVAVANTDSSVVTIWDLRKAGTSTEPVKSIQTQAAVESLYWDYTAQYLLIAGGAGMTVGQYIKSSKEWTIPLQLTTPVSAAVWGPSARSILAVDTDGALTIAS